MARERERYRKEEGRRERKEEKWEEKMTGRDKIKGWREKKGDIETM